MESADPDAAALATHCPNCGALRDGQLLTVAWLMIFNLLVWSLANVAAVMGRL